MPWILIAALVLGITGGGAGVAYAADGAVPGDALYGLDQAMESARYSLTSTPETRAALALAFADERLAEAQTLIDSGADGANVQQALDGYGVNISQAASELAAVAASGEQARAEALAQLLQSSLSVHSQVLTETRASVPESAQAYLDDALVASEAGKQAVDSVFADGMPSGQPDGAPEVPSRDLPGGQPESRGPQAPAPGADQSDSSAAGEVPSLEERLAGLDGRIAEVQDRFAAGEIEQAHTVLVSYQNEIDALAQDLAAVAQDDAARAEALATLLDAALTVHTDILSQLVDQVPDGSRAYVEQAISASQAGKEQLGAYMPAGQPPSGVPDGQP